MGALSGKKSYSGAFLFIPISLTLAIFLSIGQVCGADQQSPLEYKVKAAYLYNFIKFVEWPADMLKKSDAPIVVCLFGKDPFGNHLDQLITRTAQGHHLTVKHIRNQDEIDGCHILFISDSERKHLAELLVESRKHSVLTVGEGPEFALQGGIIGFIVKDGKVRLEINRKAAHLANLKIRAKLLEVAKIVD